MRKRSLVLTLLSWAALALASVAPARAQGGTGTITGRVTSSETGQPLSSVSVTVVGTSLGALTNAEGRYVIGQVEPGTYVVRASLIGYAVRTAEVTITAGGTASADFSLSAQAIQLEEIVAVGYGQQQRRDLTGAVASISGDAVTVEAAPTSAISNALQGKAPGVQVVVNSGVPGAGSSVRVRGTNSISANSEPLYVIDGMPVMQGTGSQDPSYNPLNEINPNDIESIQILKDASATAIYGARGANGVVLITTRRGRPGVDQITIKSSYGMQRISKELDVLGASEYMRLRNEAYRNAGRTEVPYTEQQIANARTYDYPEMMVRDGPQQNHSITLSGGDNKTRYLISGDYLNQEGILVNSAFERYALRLNMDRMLSDRFRTGTRLSVARVQQGLNRTENGAIGASANGILAAMNFDPSLPPKNEDGEWNKRARLGEQLDNPLANTLEIVDERNEWRTLGNIFAEFDVTDALRLRTSNSVNAHFWRNPYFAPSTIAPGDGAQGVAAVGDGYDRQLISENTASYGGTLGPGDVDVLGGFAVQTYQSQWSFSSSRSFPSDELKWNALGAGAGNRGVGSGYSDWALLSWYGRVNYDLHDRYLFTVNARRDGSSRFGANNKWSFFPSAAFAWRISDEAFMQDQTLFSDLKLRLSYGETGNQAVAQYQSLARLSDQFVGIGVNDEVVTLVPSGAAPNPDLKWETASEFNVGVDAGFFDNRVSLSLDAYQKETNDLLLWVGLPRTSGYSSQLQNVGSVRNRGVEMGITTVNVQSADFSWRSTLNLSVNRNEVLDLGGVDRIYPGGSRYGWFIDGYDSHIVKVGEPLGSIYGYEVNGLWQQGDSCYLTNTDECTPGEYRIVDQNGDGVIDSEDRTILGYAEPTFYGGFSNSLNWGPFSLDAFLNFSYGNEVANVSGVFTKLATGFLNESVEVLDRWTPENTDTDVPRANQDRPRRLYSTLVEDGSFLRLSSLTLGYQVPRGVFPGAEEAHLYLTGENLFVLTNYSGFDPEVNSIGGDSRLRGVDSGAYPRARAVNFGVRVTF